MVAHLWVSHVPVSCFRVMLHCCVFGSCSSVVRVSTGLCSRTSLRQAPMSCLSCLLCVYACFAPGTARPAELLASFLRNSLRAADSPHRGRCADAVGVCPCCFEHALPVHMAAHLYPLVADRDGGVRGRAHALRHRGMLLSYLTTMTADPVQSLHNHDLQTVPCTKFWTYTKGLRDL